MSRHGLKCAWNWTFHSWGNTNFYYIDIYRISVNQVWPVFILHYISIIIHERSPCTPQLPSLCVSNKSLRFGLSDNQVHLMYIVFKVILQRDETPPAYQSIVCSRESEFKQCKNNEREADIVWCFNMIVV